MIEQINTIDQLIVDHMNPAFVSIARNRLYAIKEQIEAHLVERETQLLGAAAQAAIQEENTKLKELLSALQDRPLQIKRGPAAELARKMGM